MLFMSYLTQLCRKRVNKTRIKERKLEEEQRLTRHSEIYRHGGNEFQNVSIQLALKLATANQKARCRHSEPKASEQEGEKQFQRPCFGGSEVAMARKFCLASKGGLGTLKDYVAETHWQRKVSSPQRANPAWRECKIMQKYKSSFPHFRTYLITLLEREQGEIYCTSQGKSVRRWIHQETLRNQDLSMNLHHFFYDCNVVMTMIN